MPPQSNIIQSLKNKSYACAWEEQWWHCLLPVYLFVQHAVGSVDSNSRRPRRAAGSGRPRVPRAPRRRASLKRLPSRTDSPPMGRLLPWGAPDGGLPVMRLPDCVAVTGAGTGPMPRSRAGAPPVGASAHRKAHRRRHPVRAGRRSWPSRAWRSGSLGLHRMAVMWIALL